MRVVVIGCTGHIGTYLVPRLVESGYEVLSLSRGKRQPYQQHSVWKNVEQIVINRNGEEQKGNFGKRILTLKGDIVIDLICFKPASAQQLVKSLEGKIQHFLHCGTTWIHGPSTEVATTEEQNRNPIDEYGINKAAIEDYLLEKSRSSGFPATLIHPGHIVGPGWIPVNPAGNLNLEVFEKLAKGQELILPNFGLETVHHVHADDIAQLFAKAIENKSKAVGQSFHAVSPQAITLRGFAEKIAEKFGKPANLSFMPWQEWKKTVSEKDVALTYDHISHCPCCSIAKAQKLLGYQPRYSSVDAVWESVNWLSDNGLLKL